LNYGLKGRFALVTGGSHGIGLSTAKVLMEEGCKVCICSRSQDRLREAKATLSTINNNVLTIQADVLNDEEINAVMDQIEAHWGQLHILVNNVGGGGRWGKPHIEETPIDTWREVYQKNAGAASLFTMRAIPLMRRANWGRVVTVTSIYGKEGGGRPWFNMAKAAEISLMKTLSLNSYLVRDGITFNSVAPGGIAIPGTGFDEEKALDPVGFAKNIDHNYPLGRLGNADEVASVIAFLCSDLARLVNGASVSVDGGQSHSF
jgi:3-oxoacyl-[acyl-carrier protein] reductase